MVFAAGFGSSGTTGSVHIDRPADRAEAEEVLTGRPLTEGYRPSIPAAMYSAGRGVQWFPTMLGDVEQMLLHPCVITPYNYYKSAINTVTFHVKARKKSVAQFILRESQRFWTSALTAVQEGYDYGWIGGEVSYKIDERDHLCFDRLSTFHPLDTWALVKRDEYRGLSVANAYTNRASRTGDGDRKGVGRTALWGPTNAFPGKAFWFAHNRRWDRFYGRSQLYGAWRPWRRLGFRDGAEEVVDGGVYRFAYRGPILYYPPNAFARADGSVDYDAANMKAREFVEMAKAGVSVAFPNIYDEQGHRKWELDWPEHVINVSSLVEYCHYLEQQISLGIGVPPELIQAADTGSGWSGRKIPMQGFYHGQTGNARAIFAAFRQQILEPLVWWNFGPEAARSFDVGVELKLPKALSGDEQQQPGMGAPPPGGMGGEQGAEPGGAEGGGNPLAGLLGGGGQ